MVINRLKGFSVKESVPYSDMVMVMVISLLKWCINNSLVAVKGWEMLLLVLDAALNAVAGVIIGWSVIELLNNVHCVKKLAKWRKCALGVCAPMTHLSFFAAMNRWPSASQCSRGEYHQPWERDERAARAGIKPSEGKTMTLTGSWKQKIKGSS